MKKYLFGLLAVVLAIGFSAYTTKKVNTSTVYAIFQSDVELTPGSTVEMALRDHTNWQIDFTEPSNLCEPGDGLCYVEIDSDIYSSEEGESDEEKFANFLSSQPSALQFVENQNFQSKDLE